MCGRYTLTETNPDVLAEVFDLPEVPDLAPRYNVAPTQPVATIVRDADSARNRLAIMSWGLIPSWAKDRSWQSKLINARGETVHEKPSFRSAFKRRRCLVVADGFYEWQAQPSGPKQPLYITLTDHAVFGLAGLYEFWTDPATGDEVVSCTIITTAANDLLAPVHDRMPVILPRERYADWLDPALDDPLAARSMLGSYPAAQMNLYPVSRDVNRVSNDGPELIARVS